MSTPPKGLLLVDKAPGCTSFDIVSLLRRLTREKTIGHAGTLDPFASGVMVMLIGREFTRRSSTFLSSDKQYRAIATLGIATDSHDKDGRVVSRSEIIPTQRQVELALASFQGEILQVPPMFSAKKIEGKKLYELARRGIVIERQPVTVRVQIECIRYSYPELELLIDCSKGTYIRSLGYRTSVGLWCLFNLTHTFTRRAVYS